MKSSRHVILLISLFFAVVGCSVSYSFTGASISPDVKTYTIDNFSYRAALVNPTLTDYLVEQLRDKFTRQTSLDYANDGGDLEFEGSITGYDIQPMAIKSDDNASMNRLTVSLKVKFTNNKNHEQDFESDFSEYAEFTADQLLSDVELVESIVMKLVEDVFNKSVANW